MGNFSASMMRVLITLIFQYIENIYVNIWPMFKRRNIKIIIWHYFTFLHIVRYINQEYVFYMLYRFIKTPYHGIVFPLKTLWCCILWAKYHYLKKCAWWPETLQKTMTVSSFVFDNQFLSIFYSYFLLNAYYRQATYTNKWWRTKW